MLSSLYEGFPNVLLEAALNKKYIVSSDCPTVPKELIKSYKYWKLYKKNSISHLSITNSIPVIFGVLTVHNMKQAIERAYVSKKNKGGEAMKTGLEMLKLYESYKK